MSKRLHDIYRLLEDFIENVLQGCSSSFFNFKNKENSCPPSNNMNDSLFLWLIAQQALDYTRRKQQR